MDKLICTFVAFLHFIYRFTVFFDQPNDVCTCTVPVLASVMVFLSIYLALININIYPEKYISASFNFVRIFIEATEALFIFELGMCFIWSRLEKNVKNILQLLLNDHINENDYYISLFIALIALFILINTLILTKSMTITSKFAFTVYDELHKRLEIIWNLNGIQCCNNYWIKLKRKVSSQFNVNECYIGIQVKKMSDPTVDTAFKSSETNDQGASSGENVTNEIKNVSHSDGNLKKRKKQRICLF